MAAKITFIAAAILFSCLLGSPAWGQNTGALSGTVEDATGQYVVGDDVRLRNQITGQEFSTSADKEGQFRFDQVAFGDYLRKKTMCGGLRSLSNAVGPCNFSMCAEGAIRDHDDYPGRAGCKNMGMSDEFGVVAWTQLNRLHARLMEFEVVCFHFKCMDARTFCVDTQREFIGVRRLNGHIEIKGPADAQFEMINSAGERGERGMGHAMAYAISALR